MSENRICILVTGASGQLGQAIKEESVKYQDIDFIYTSRNELDICDQKSIYAQIDLHNPTAIINTAAYTAVDRAESEEDKAFFINERGVENVARACKERSIKLIHISTDYVFDGTARVPYLETDPVNPQTVYGQSKLAGEQVIQEIAPSEYYVIRTSWLYSKNGHNFYNTMLRLAREGKDISVVDDQWGSPTLANDLAEVLIHIVRTGDASKSGVYHYSGEGECTWYAFAKAILEKHHSGAFSLDPVGTDQYPTQAARPCYSVLNKMAIKDTFNLYISDWEAII